MMVRVNRTAAAAALVFAWAASGAAQDQPVTPPELSTARYIDPANGPLYHKVWH